MKSKEWMLLCDLLLDIVSNNNVYSKATADRLAKLIDYVGKL